MVHNSATSVIKKTVSFSKLNCDEDLLKKRLPITQWLPRYKARNFFRDLLAGLTVSLTEIPQSIAYANIASLPPEYGLYSCLMGGLVYAIFGTSKYINIGPTSILSLMIKPYVEEYGPQVAVMLSFLCGAITFVLGLCNLGFVIDFFSYPIVVGFICAASLEIASTQLKNFFGVETEANDFLTAWAELGQKFDKIRTWDTVLSAASLITLIFLREIKRFGSFRHKSEWSKARYFVGIGIYFLALSGNMIVICIGTGLAYYWRDSSPFLLTGHIKSGIRSFGPPPFTVTNNNTVYTMVDIVSNAGAPILFLPLMAILEHVSVAKTFSHGRSLDASQEILTVGLANIFSSFVGSMPTTGAFSRTAINRASGVKTPLGGVFTTLMVFLAIVFIVPTLHYVPKATMAAVIICAMIYLFEYCAFTIFWRNKKLDMLPFLATFIGVLIIDIKSGILIGLAINIAFVLYPSARPAISVVPVQVRNYHGDVFIFKPLDNLQFPSAEYIKERVLELKGKNTVVIFDGQHLRNIDLTVARSIVALHKEMHKQGEKIIFWNFKTWIINLCLNLNNSQKESFKSGDLEDIIQDSIL